MRVLNAAVILCALLAPPSAMVAMAQPPVTPAPPPPPDLPVIPVRTCNVRDHGATGNGSTNDTPAINAAITACNSAGGGTVLFPSGTYMAAGIRLKSRIRLKLDSGAMIKARSSGYDAPESNSCSQYQDYGHSHFRNGLMWGENITDFAIEGPGRIDGANLITGDPSSGQGDKQISIKVGTRLSFTNLTQTEGGHFYYLLSDCRHVTVRNVTLTGGRDGIDFMGCKNVEVDNLRTRDLSDDSCALKNDYALCRRLTTQDIYIHDSDMQSRCNVIQVGSETAGDFLNCHWRNINIAEAGKAGIGLQTNDGGVLDGFYIDNVTMTRAANPIFISTSTRLRTPENVTAGRVRNVFISNVVSTGSAQSNSREPVNTSTIQGRPGVRHENIYLSNVRITMPGGGTFDQGNINPPLQPSDNYNPRAIGTRPAYGLYVRHVSNLQLYNVRLDFTNTDLRPAITARDVNGFEIDDIGVERASGSQGSIKLNDIWTFWLHNSLGWADVQEAFLASASYSAGSTPRVTPTPTPTATPPVPTPTPTPTQPTTGDVEITPPASGVTASTSDGNLPANTVDSNLATRWSANGDGQWIQYDLGTEQLISYVKIAVYNGNSRQNRFDLQVGDGTTWTNVLTNALTTGTTTQLVAYDFPDQTARFVRYVGHMSNVGTFNSLTEVEIWRTETPVLTPTPTATPTDATPTPTPTPTATPGMTYLWLEAESGTITAPMQVRPADLASGSFYVEVAAGNNSQTAAPSSGWASFTFSAPAGTYKVWGRVIAPVDTDDSFWVRMDGGSWTNWNNITPGSTWHWDDVHNGTASATMTYSLAAGTHTLTFAYREDGTRLDRVLITNDLAFVPTGLGQ